MRSTEHLKVSLDEHVATVVLDIPPVNALAPGSVTELKEIFDELSEDREVRVIILTGEGRVFSAGADLKASSRPGWPQVDRPDEGATRLTDPGRLPREALASVMSCSVPVIAAVNGAATGAGWAFISMCDFVIASERARFGMTEINVGILGGSSHLIRMLGPYLARRMFFTGEILPAAELADSGFIHSIVPHEELMPAALALAKVIAAKSPIAMRLAKESILVAEEHHDVKQAYRIEQNYTRRLLMFEDSTEARLAWAEKREPQWAWK